MESTIGTGEFSKSGLTIVMVGPNDHQGGVIDWSSSAASRVIPAGQKRVLIKDEAGVGPDPMRKYFGYCYPGPNIPSAVDVCHVYQDNITFWIDAQAIRLNWTATQKSAAAARLRLVTITHELAHGVAMTHHENGPGSVYKCFMRYAIGESIIQSPPQHSIFDTLQGCNEVNLLMRLR